MALNGEHLRVAVEWSTWMQFENDFQNPSGTAWDVFTSISKLLNFTYTIIRSVDNTWGSDFGNGTVTGMVGMVYRNEVDMAIGPFALTYGRFQLVDYSNPLHYDHDTLLLPRSQLEKDMGSFLQTFSTQVWVGLLSCLAFASVLGWLLGLTPAVRSIVDAADAEGKKVFFDPFWVATIFTSDVVLVYPSVASGTLFLATLFLAHLFVSTAYSAVLTSLLAAPRVRIPVDSIQDLVQYGQLPWAFERGTSTVEMFLEAVNGTNPVLKAIGEKIQYIDDCFIDRKMVVEKKMAFFCDSLPIKKLIDLEFSENGTCNYYMARTPILTIALSFIFRKRSHLKAQFDPWIDAFRESGLIEKSIADSIWNASTCMKKPGSENINAIQTFRMEDLGGIFLLLAAGVVVALVVLLLERFVAYCVQKSFN